MATPPSQDGLRLFTVDEANALVPALDLGVGRLARLRADATALVEVLGGAEVALALLQGGTAPRGAEEPAARFRGVVEGINALVERVNGMGCVVKDLDSGLVDFLSVLDGEAIFLCWQFGEPAVAHWHSLEGGFSGRQPIEGARARPTGLPN